MENSNLDNKSVNNDLSKKHGIYSVVLSILGVIIPIFAPFALWQGIKAQREGDSKWGTIGFIFSNIIMALFVVRIAFMVYGYFSI